MPADPSHMFPLWNLPTHVVAHRADTACPHVARDIVGFEHELGTIL
jgi:hypothetical protein